MSDDPRDILQAAGAECAEVERLLRNPLLFMPQAESVGEHPTIRDMKAAIPALARLAAMYKYERDLCSVDLCVALGEPALADADDPRVGSSSAVLADIHRRWAKIND